MFMLPDLPYPYNALEPYIDKETMKLHHDKHHATYLKNFNDSLIKYPELFNQTPEALLSSLTELPDDIKVSVKNQGGGYVNHNIFWQNMAPTNSSSIPVGTLSSAINKYFGNYEKFKDLFSTTALKHFGSGWTWLILADGKLEITETSNQDTPISQGKKILLALDIWEHAYYLKYQNRRIDYIANWWNVVNWDAISENFDKMK
jgi:superoxide dismutase, Fe-Mn family